LKLIDTISLQKISFSHKMIQSQTIPFPSPETPTFTFIDLFAGIGGFRIALQNLGGKCVFSSEIDKYARQTYEVNFGDITPN